MSGLCRTLAAGRSGRACKLPARLNEYVLPGQKPASCKVSARHAASQAEELCPTTSHSQQHPPAPGKRIIIKLSMKASVMGQGRATQLQAKQTSPAILLQAGHEQATPPTDSSAHAAIPSRATNAKPFKVAPVERPVTRHFSLQQRSSSKLKLRIKLKRTTATTDQQPQRMSTSLHQQKRHDAHSHQSTAKHESSASPPATPSAAVLHNAALSKTPASSQVLSPMAPQLLTTAAVAAYGSTTQFSAVCRQPETAGDYYSRPCSIGTPCCDSIDTAGDAHPLSGLPQASKAEAALCPAAKPKLLPAVSRAQHDCAASSVAQHAGGPTPPCIKQR